MRNSKYSPVARGSCRAFLGAQLVSARRKLGRSLALPLASLFFIVVAPATLGALRPIPGDYPFHLGGPVREWSIFEGRRPLGPELRLKFQSSANPREYTLFIGQDDVKQDWTVNLNGRKLGSLFLMEADLVHTLPIPANLLRDGENELHIASK